MSTDVQPGSVKAWVLACRPATLTAAVVRDDDLYLAQVGDSRCYLLRDGDLIQLTEDHSWVAEQVRSASPFAITAAVIILAGGFMLLAEWIAPLRRTVEPKLRRIARNLSAGGVSLAGS